MLWGWEFPDFCVNDLNNIRSLINSGPYYGRVAILEFHVHTK